MPPHRWLTMRRIEVAKGLLLRNQLGMAEIALASGFADQSHLTRVFGRLVGNTPRAWQRIRML